jgi:hypothetical protein
MEKQDEQVRVELAVDAQPSSSAERPLVMPTTSCSMSGKQIMLPAADEQWERCRRRWCNRHPWLFTALWSAGVAIISMIALSAKFGLRAAEPFFWIIVCVAVCSAFLVGLAFGGIPRKLVCELPAAVAIVLLTYALGISVCFVFLGGTALAMLPALILSMGVSAAPEHGPIVLPITIAAALGWHHLRKMPQASSVLGCGKESHTAQVEESTE